MNVYSTYQHNSTLKFLVETDRAEYFVPEYAVIIDLIYPYSSLYSSFTIGEYSPISWKLNKVLALEKSTVSIWLPPQSKVKIRVIIDYK